VLIKETFSKLTSFWSSLVLYQFSRNAVTAIVFAVPVQMYAFMSTALALRVLVQLELENAY